MSATEIETKARSLGWRPKEDFKGKPEDFVEADIFVERGREILPILRKNNEKLEGQLTKAQQETAALRQQVEDATKAVAELKKFNTEMTRQAAEQARTELMAQLKQAKKDGDTDREVELGEQLSEASAVIREAKKAPTQELKKEPEGEKKVSSEVAAQKAEFESWQNENAWYGTDTMKTAVANGIAAQLRAENSPLTGVAFYKEIAKRTEKFMDREGPTGDKVEGGGRGSGGGSGGGGKGKSFADMPEAGRAYCEKLMARGDITVGKGKTFETADAFRKHYAETYFARSE